MIAVAMFALQVAAEGDQQLPTSVLVISAVFSGLGLIITAAGAVWIQRGQKAARTAEARIGEPNGQHDIVTMIVTTQRMIVEHTQDFGDFRRETNARFDGLHAALVTERARIDAIERPVIEDRQ